MIRRRGAARPRVRLAVASGAALVLSVAGCAALPPQSSPSPTPTTASSTTVAAPSSASPPLATAAPDGPPAVIDAEYLPGLAAQVRLPRQPGAAPVIVLVPGGGWRSADPAGLVPLAERMTERGVSTVLITYRTTSSGSTFPEAVDDVACAIRWSAAEVAERGHPATEVIVLGHSAGGHLAALVSLSGEEFGSACPAPPVAVDGLVGLAGVYDVEGFRDYLARWMGFAPTERPQEWRRADPLTWARDGGRIPASLRVLLVHGDEDTTVPTTQTEDLRAALEDRGIAVRADVLPGVDHLSVFDAGIVGPILDGWLDEDMGENP